MTEIKTSQTNQGPDMRERDETVYLVCGPDGVAIEPVCEETVDAMMAAYHREGDTGTGGKTHSKCRCGCS